MRLDSFVAACVPELSRSYAQRLIARGAVRVNGDAGKSKHYILRAGDAVAPFVPAREPLRVAAEDIPLRIVHEDEDVLVVDKPKGMVVHPAPGNETGTLVNAVLFHCGAAGLSSINGVIRPGIVHRIDKDTSGLLVVAKNDRAHRALSEALARHEVTREYEAVVHNNFAEDAGKVDLPIGRDPANRLRRAVVKDGRTAVTHYRVLERFGGFTRLALRLETGRTHQIRVHMAHIKHPLLGDPLYGPKKKAPGVETQMLHAGLLGFRHPRTGAYTEFSCPPPEDFDRILKSLRGV
ncbi:MAG: RluA family pseudouridine synthase [Clostridiales Family XIII bacterium]|nr:RluA family pseudouridine synthase [Clostridiales Family XIII bacterium]